MDSAQPRPGGSSAERGPGSGLPRTVTKKELVARIAEKTGQTKVVAKDVIQLFLDEIIRELGRGNRLEFREFGVFEIKARAARRAQNPRTLEKVEVPSKRVVKFKVGRLMKQRVAAMIEAAARGQDPNDVPFEHEADDDD
jgi:integration host factor subunit beta